MQNSVAPGTAQRAPRKRGRRAKAIIWTIVGLFAVCVVAMGVSAFIAKSAVDTLMDEGKALAADIDDSAKTSQHIDGMTSAAHRAHLATAHPIWRASEVLPFVGDDLRAVRLLAGTADTLISDVAAPLASFDLSSIGPQDGALNAEAIAELGKTIEQVAPVAEEANIRLIAEGIDQGSLLAPLREPVAQVTDVLGTASDVLRRLAIISPQLPTMLGMDEPRDYLVLVQNTAEMRTLGGNPGTLLKLTLTNGSMEITQTASSGDTDSGRATPIVPLEPSTEQLFTDRVGRYIQDTTMTPDFAQTAHIATAFWEDATGSSVDGVLAVDPILLSYILQATGPVELPDGESLTSDNVADQLLNQVYWRFPGNNYEEIKAQDAYFAAAAGAVFGQVTHSQNSFASLATQLYKGYEEGRILYNPTDATEAKAIAHTLFTGPLRDDSNAKATTLGVFVNDNTEGKLDYYANMNVTASSNVCTAADDEDRTFTATATYNYNLKPDQVESLPRYISTANYFPKGQKSTNLVFYGPAGSIFESATLDGEDFVPQYGAEDLGRQAVLINFISDPSTSHTVEVTFTAPPGEYGPLDVRTTPMVRPVPVDVDSSLCGQ